MDAYKPKVGEPSRPFYRPPQKTRAELRETLKVGDHVATFDSNRRVYAHTPPGQYSSGSPFFRGYFVRDKVRGETSRSWIIGWGRGSKVPKKTLAGLYSCEDIDSAAFVQEHGYKITEALRRYSGHRDSPQAHDRTGESILRKVAELIGYEIPEGDK